MQLAAITVLIATSIAFIAYVWTAISAKSRSAQHEEKP